MKNGARVLDFMAWCFLGWSSPNVVLRSQTQVMEFFEILWFYWIHFMILGKMRYCLWKLELGFLTYGLISPLPNALGPNKCKLVFKPLNANVTALRSNFFFMSSYIKFCMNKALTVRWGNFEGFQVCFPV